jgi:hypothetical protein
MQITFKNTPEQVELIKAMGSKNPTVSWEAQEAFAAFITPVIKEVLLTAGSVSRIYRDVEFDEDSDPSIPLDLFYNEGAGYITIWSQSQAGGMPSSQIEGIKEMKFGTYRLDSAVSWNKKYARKNRLDVISKAVERLVNEVLIKQERNGWAVVLKALAEASTRTINGGTLRHGVASATSGTFTVGDLNALIVRIKRINESFSGNTPVQPYSNGITDLFVSPEIKGQIRAMAFNPIMPTSAVSNPTTTVTSLPDAVRQQVWSQGGMQSIFDINIVELIELGLSQKYNTLFDSFVAASTFPGHNATYWNGTTGDQILIGVDNTRGALLRPVIRNGETSSTFSVQVDNQFQSYGVRADSKQGVYGSLEEGRLVIDSRALCGISV